MGGGKVCYLGAMKFALANPADGYLIHAYDERRIQIGEQRFSHSLILLRDRIIRDWRPASFDQLRTEDLQIVRELDPDLVLLGTGSRQHFPPPALYQALIEAGIGLEAMTTPAACRTYNILAAEGRRVAAALLFG